MKAGLHSLTYAGLFYEGSSLTLEQIIERAADCGYGDGAAFFRSRYAAEFPQARCAALRASELPQRAAILRGRLLPAKNRNSLGINADRIFGGDRAAGKRRKCCRINVDEIFGRDRGR